jgi:hypothetical protein
MVTKRGRQVRALLILAGLILALFLAGRVWFDGQGWCIGSMTQCIGI